MTLDELFKKVQKEGPAYVMLDKDGTCEMRQIALTKNPDLQWDVIYFRQDGYTLGCEFYLSQFAEALHRDQWVAVQMRGAVKPKILNFGS